MKKYLIFALLASFTIHSTFAAKSGDFQLSLGWSGDSIDLDYDGDEGLANATYNGAVISLKNYNLTVSRVSLGMRLEGVRHLQALLWIATIKIIHHKTVFYLTKIKQL